MEYSAFEQVPQKARNFSFWDQVIVWFSSASIPAAWYYGALMAGWQGIPGALLLIFVVSTLSLLPWSVLGRMAAETGGSSMAIVRPTFGIRGAIIPSFFYLLFGVGWAVVNVFLGAIALSFILKALIGFPSYLDPHNGQAMILYILIVCILQSIFAIKGHAGIKILQRVATVLFVFLGLYQTILVLTHWNFVSLIAWKPTQSFTFATGPFNYKITLPLLIDLLIAYNWTWEFIGDFSRFAKNKNAGMWGPFLGANLAQYWWFLVGSFAVVFLYVTTHSYNPLVADPSSTSIALGLGWIAALVILFATITSNAGNIYASALGLSNIISLKKNIRLNKLLIFAALVSTIAAFTPLLSTQFVGFYLFFLDFLGAIVVPLWTITIVDYLFVKKRKYNDDIFKKKGGAYWYYNGWNILSIIILFAGVALYWIIAYVYPSIRESITAALPTMLFVAIAYIITAGKKSS